MKNLLHLVLLASTLQLQAQNVGWLGDGSGIFPNASPPVEWSARKNIIWKTSVGSAYSSPIVVGKCVLVTSEPDILHCLDIESGKELWSKSTPVSALPPDQQAKVVEPPKESGSMAATPCSDGERVYVVIANGIVAAYELKTGNRVWTQVINSPPQSSEGRSASPVRIGNKLIVHLSELYALDAATGSILWQQADTPESYGTPVVGSIGGVEIVVVPEGSVVRVSDGKVLGKLEAKTNYASPTLRDNMVCFVDTSFSFLKLPDAISGNSVSATELWSDTIEGEVYATALISDNLAYTSTASGKLQVLDIKTKSRTEKQLEICDVRPDGQPMDSHDPNATLVYASPTLAGNYIFFSNNTGKTTVLERGKNPKVVSTNDLGEGSGATLAFSGKFIFIRGGSNLYCIGEK